MPALALPLLARPVAGRAQVASRGVTLLVGAAAGSRPDHWARAFAPFLERHWPHAAITVLNHPGEGGLAAARRLAEAPPDGRVIASVATPQLLARAVEAASAGLLDRLRFFAAVAEEPLVLVGPPGPVADLAALRGLPAPLTLGTPPQGSAPHLAGVALGRQLGLGVLAFATAAAARQAVMAGNIPCAMLAAPEAIDAWRDGQLLALGLAQDRRSPLLPEVPTLGEQGVPLALVARRGFAAPAGVPAALLEPLLGALQAAVADPEFAAQAEAQGFVPQFLTEVAWTPQLRKVTGELAARWTTDPWTERRD